MTATTMLKRINSKRKELARHEREIRYYQKEYLTEENLRDEGRRWIDYHSKFIDKIEAQIAEMSKEASELATEDERKAMIKAMADDMEKHGFKDHGITTKGLRYGIERNKYGYTDRTTHCFSMTIEGKGMVFTSGTLETVAEYIINN